MCCVGYISSLFLDDEFGGRFAQVILRSHRPAVRADSGDQHHITGGCVRRKQTVVAQHIAGLADAAYHVHCVHICVAGSHCARQHCGVVCEVSG
jgi:hypothetical protein